jgi:SAM-dependent methyltransferase
MTGRINETAARGFERGAADYEAGRPGYAPEAIEKLVSAMGIDADSVVVDVGAGTGKFTRMLEATAASVLAVEPVEAMRRVLVERSPGLEVHDGTAEALPLSDASADVITVAQAFHWFDHPRALDEFARVLRPGGWLALIWNARETDVPWVGDLVAVMDRVAGEAPRFRADEGNWRDSIAAHDAFGPMEAATYANPVTMDVAMMRARVASTSYVSALPDAARAAVLDEITEIVVNGPVASEGERFIEPYRTELFWSRRK